MIKRLVLLGNDEALAAQGSYNPARDPHRLSIALHSEAHSAQRWSHAGNKGHHGMNRCYACSPLSQRGKFFAGERTTGMQDDLPCPICVGQRSSTSSDRAVRHAQPDDICVHMKASNDIGCCSHLPGECTSFEARRLPIRRENFGDAISDRMQGRGQPACKITGAHDCDGWSDEFALSQRRQHNSARGHREKFPAV